MNDIVSFIIVGFIFLLIFFIYDYIKSKFNSPKIIPPPKPSPFDQRIAQGEDSICLINSFLKRIFNKFINQILIEINEKSSNSIKILLEKLSNEKTMTDKSIGFLLLVRSLMSDDLKLLFNRYYNIIDENGELNENYDTYIIEWFILQIRFISAKYTVAINGNYSTEHMVEINSKLFFDIETELYDDLGFINKEEETKKHSK